MPDWFAEHEKHLGYCEWHCTSPRALFSHLHCAMLYQLAGYDVQVKGNNVPGRFHPMHEAEAKPLIEEARRRYRKLKECDDRLLHAVADQRIAGGEDPFGPLEVTAEEYDLINWRAKTFNVCNGYAGRPLKIVDSLGGL